MPKKEPLTPKEALKDWAEVNEITPTQFAKDMDYTYNHAYQLLRGNADVTFDLLGRFVMVYGTEAAAELAQAFLAAL